jgi:hypothetical protein
VRCCSGDGGAAPWAGWASAVALQGEVANHRKVRRLRAGVLSVAEKARHGARQVWAKKASVRSLPTRTRSRRGSDKSTPVDLEGELVECVAEVALRTRHLLAEV